MQTAGVRLLVATGLLCAPAALASVARADIIATVDVTGSTGVDRDIAMVNAGTGTRAALPAGINTSADEVHPSLSADGNRLVFQRRDHAAGTNRIILFDLSTGRSADLFDAFTAQQDQPQTPWISPDGSQVLTGRPLEPRDPATPSGVLQASITRTSLASFPAGPFPKTRQTFPNLFGFPGGTTQPIQLGGLVAVEIGLTGISHEVELSGSAGTGVIGEDGVIIAHPALGSGVVVFKRAPVSGAVPTNGNLAFRTSDPTRVAAAADAFLPRLVNSDLDESRPAFTSDGRYLGFVRFTLDDHDRLFVFDTQTQTLLNPSGVDLGAVTTPSLAEQFALDQNLVLRQTPVITSISLSNAGLVSLQLLRGSGVGILVQRIIGRHRLLGKVVPTLRLVGRVPFGVHGAGRFRTRWDRTVNGHRLRPGRYLVTVRAVTRRGVVRELGSSFIVRVGR